MQRTNSLLWPLGGIAREGVAVGGTPQAPQANGEVVADGLSLGA